MAFQANLKDVDDILGVELSIDNDALQITDYSNYDEIPPEAGHERPNFSLFRKFTLKRPGLGDYVFSSDFSVSGDGDELSPVPSSNNDNVFYRPGTKIPDGSYTISLISVPEHQLGVDWTGDEDYVVVRNSTTQELEFYLCIQDTLSASIPLTDTDYWRPVTESEVSSKYRSSCRFSVANSLCSCVDDAVVDAVCEMSKTLCDDISLCKNEKFMRAVKSILAERAVTILAEKEEWDKVQTVLDYTNSICCGGC